MVGAVWGCLVLSGDVLCCLELPGGIRGMSRVFWDVFLGALGRGFSNRRRENLGIAKIGLTPPPCPNPGTLVDLTTKARKCDSRHFDVKSA